MMIYAYPKTFSGIPGYLAVFFALLLSSGGCTGSEEATAGAEETENAVAAETASRTGETVPDPAHNARNALDYYGTYEGMLPCASCEGIETRLSLYPDQQYRLEMTYIGRSEEAFVDEGRFRWNEAGTTITLEGISAQEQPTQYFVAENRLIQLDMAGERITGELAEAYELHKPPPGRQAWNNPLPDRERFVLQALNGESIEPPKAAANRPDLHFDTNENRIYGSGSCNRFNAGFEAPGDGELQFTPIAATKMMCPEMALEDRYFTVLRQVEAYEYDPEGRRLLLLDKEGIIIARFQQENDS